MATQAEFMLREICSNPNWKIIKENKSGIGNTLEVEGRFQHANKKNHNGRMYPSKLMVREVKKLQPLLMGRKLFGELDHPEILETSLKNVSHVITKLWMEGNEVKGRMEILPTQHGNTLRALYESNCQPGVSSRGSGRAIERDGYYEIAPDFALKTFDAVSDPSTHDAYPKMLSEAQIIRPNTKLKVPGIPNLVTLEEWQQVYLSGSLVW